MICGASCIFYKRLIEYKRYRILFQFFLLRPFMRGGAAVEFLFVQVFFNDVRYFEVVQIGEWRVGVAFYAYFRQVEQARVAAAFVYRFDEFFRPGERKPPDVDVEYLARLRSDVVSIDYDYREFRQLHEVAF